MRSGARSGKGGRDALAPTPVQQIRISRINATKAAIERHERRCSLFGRMRPLQPIPLLLPNRHGHVNHLFSCLILCISSFGCLSQLTFNIKGRSSRPLDSRQVAHRCPPRRRQHLGSNGACPRTQSVTEGTSSYARERVAERPMRQSSYLGVVAILLAVRAATRVRV